MLSREKIKEIAKKAGYVYVFDKTSVLYIDESQSKDITKRLVNLEERLVRDMRSYL